MRRVAVEVAAAAAVVAVIRQDRQSESREDERTDGRTDCGPSISHFTRVAARVGGEMGGSMRRRGGAAVWASCAEGNGEGRKEGRTGNDPGLSLNAVDYRESCMSACLCLPACLPATVPHPPATSKGNKRAELGDRPRCGCMAQGQGGGSVSAFESTVPTRVTAPAAAAATHVQRSSTVPILPIPLVHNCKMSDFLSDCTRTRTVDITAHAPVPC